MKDTLIYSKFSLNFKGNLREFSHPIVMGILNVTPDSFFEGSRHQQIDSLHNKAGQMIEDGATILDIGGYSSRPGAAEVSVQEEIDRVIPAIEAIHKAFPECILSIDTFRSEVAELAVKAGASVINDISGGKQDPKIFELAATYQMPYILMHMRGTPQTMQENTEYKNLTMEINQYFSQQLNAAKKAGVIDIILDPGFGFSKNLEQNYELLDHLENLHLLNRPLLVGLSRKSMIYKKLNISPEESLNGTIALNTIALTKGASILRVHDVKEASELIQLMHL